MSSICILEIGRLTPSPEGSHLAGVSPLPSLCPSHREAVLPKLHLDEDYPCSLVGNWNTWYGEQDQAGEVPTSAVPLPPSPGPQHLLHLAALHSLSTAAPRGVSVNVVLIVSLPCPNTCVGSPLPCGWPMRLCGSFSAQPLTLSLHILLAYCAVPPTTVSPSRSTLFLLFPLPEAVCLPCPLSLAHSSTHLLFWHRHYLLLEASLIPSTQAWSGISHGPPAPRTCLFTALILHPVGCFSVSPCWW